MKRVTLAAILMTGLVLSGAPILQAEEKKDTPTLHLHLSDGSLFIGTPVSTGLSLEMEFAQVTLSFSKIASVQIAEASGVVTMDLRNGDTISGTLGKDALKMETLFGEIAVPMKHIRRLSIRHIYRIGEDARRGLVFYNRLGSDEEVRKSVVGPGLSSYTGPAGIAVAGQRAFVKGKHGKAVTLSGRYSGGARVRNLVLGNLDKLINPDSGCIEFWFYYTAETRAYQHGVYRCFDGSYGLGSGISVYALASIDGTPHRMVFGIGLGGQGVSVSVPLSRIPKNRWVHIAAVWDREGISLSKEALRLYLDGRRIAGAGGASWGTVPGKQADIAGGNDGNLAGKFRMDELKIWRVAKTDFSDRFEQTIMRKEAE